jgi:hypothetical protein
MQGSGKTKKKKMTNLDGDTKRENKNKVLKICLKA